MPTQPLDKITVIKNFCKTISSYNAVEILMEYDGSGDSGDGDFSVRLPQPAIAPGTTIIGTPLENQSTTFFRSFRPWIDDILKHNDPLLSRDQVDAFEDAVFELLPSGWEINDGSYGSVAVAVATGKIHVEHNERYTEVNQSEFNY